MATEYGALCSDFFVNQKMAVKMDLPQDRETLLALFDRVRRERPGMTNLRRYDGEVSLESPEDEQRYEWLAIRRTSIRSGSVNPDSLGFATKLHRMILQVSPYFLTISPLDIAYIEISFGFDLEAELNRNDVVFDALLGNSAFAQLVDIEQEEVLDCQPSITFALNSDTRIQAMIDIKTRVKSNELQSGQYHREPITIYATVRNYGPFNSIDDLPEVCVELVQMTEQLADERVLPKLILPIREVISSRPS